MATDFLSEYINRENKNEPIWFFVSAFIYPLWGLVASIINWRRPWAKNIFWCFCIFYGMTHIFNPVGGFDADGGRYAESLIRYSYANISFDSFKMILYDGESNTDVLIPLIIFLTAKITTNAHILFCIFAIIFGYFYSRNIWLILDYYASRKLSVSLGIFVILFALICPIWQINGVRMWTALQIFAFGVFKSILKQKPKNVIWCLIAPLIHFSFFLPCVLLLAFRYLPKNRTIYLAFFFITLTINELDILSIKNFLIAYDITGAFHTKIDVYTADWYVEAVALAEGKLATHVILSKTLIKYISIIFAILGFFQLSNNKDNKNNKHQNENNVLLRMYCFSLFMYSIANIASLIPSGGRFIVLSQMLLIGSILVIYSKTGYSSYSRIINPIIASLAILPILMSIRTGMDYWGISLLISNPITCWFLNDNMPIIDYVKLKI